MMEAYTSSDKSKIQKKLASLDKTSIINYYKIMDIDVSDKNKPTNILINNLLEVLEKDDNYKDKLEILDKYVDLYPQIKSLPIISIIKLFPFTYRNSIKKSKNKNYLISEIEKLIFTKKIGFDILVPNIDKYVTISNIKKIKDENLLKVIAKKVAIEIDEDANRDEIILKISNALELEKCSLKDVMNQLELVKNDKKKQSKSSNNAKISKEIEALTLQISLLDQKLQKQQTEILSLSERVNDAIEIMKSNQKVLNSHIVNISEKMETSSTEKLITALRSESLKSSSITPKSFDQINDSLKKHNFSKIDIFRDGLSIIIFDYLMKISKEVEWDFDLNEFYQILHDETKNLVGSTSTTVKIPSLRNLVCERMGFDSKSFDSLLIKCREKDWVQLEVGTPIGVDDAEWLEYGKNRFYYMKLKRR